MRSGTLLVGPPGNGNIGDQAMVEAFLENVAGPVVIVQRNPGDVLVPAPAGQRVTLVALPDLIFGQGPARARDLSRYRALVDGVEQVAVVGADMMDGAYTIVGSVHRILLAELAVLSGAPTRLLGFSWSDRARPAALRALRRAVSAGVVAVARDPESAARLRAGGAEVVDGSDIVFAARSVIPGAVPEIDRSRPFAVLNVSALVARAVAPRAYTPIVTSLTDAGLTVVLVPHVLRGTSDDVAACRAVAALHPETQLVERLLAPAEVRGLVADARLVVTGRMHLAIMAAVRGVPAITFSTQGKVQGLMALLGVDRLCVEPGPDLGARVVPLVHELLATDGFHDELAAHLDAVRSLATKNFAHPAARPAVAAA